MNYSKVNYLIIVLLTGLFAAGCRENKSESKLSFGNNIEHAYWKESASTIKFPGSHSGNYSCKLDKQNAFSEVLDLPVKEISSKPLKRVVITAWFMLTGRGSEQNLVLDIRDSTLQNSFEWINIDAADYVSELNKWTKAELAVDLTKKDRNTLNKVYRIYAANSKDEPVYVDDIEVYFEE